MSIKLQAVRGTKDLFAEEFEKFWQVVNKTRKIALNYGCKDLSTPIFEFAEIFIKSLGDTSDVVGKEMYNLSDRGGEILTLRPEFTAAIARCFFSNGWQQLLPLRLFSFGPVFRYERPQRGRFRQFNQINVEYLGIASPFNDVELINCAIDMLETIDVQIMNNVVLEINSLGNVSSRVDYKTLLVEYLNDYRQDLSEDSIKRLDINPLRILDSKDLNDRKIVTNAPKLSASLDQESQDYFGQVLDLLQKLNIKYQINDNLVRGLDYYQHTIFEIITENLGAQGTLLAGGRYDGLYKQMGGTSVPAIGFAMGIERIIDLLSANIKIETNKPIIIIAIGEKADIFALQLAKILRNSNFYVELSYHRKDMGKKMQYANKINAKIALIFGDNELDNQHIKVKNLESGLEELVSLDAILDYLAKY